MSDNVITNLNINVCNITMQKEWQTLLTLSVSMLKIIFFTLYKLNPKGILDTSKKGSLAQMVEHVLATLKWFQSPDGVFCVFCKFMLCLFLGLKWVAGVQINSTQSISMFKTQSANAHGCRFESCAIHSNFFFFFFFVKFKFKIIPFFAWYINFQD